MNFSLHIRQYLKMAAQNLYLPAVYAFARHRRVNPALVLFADAHHDQRPENFSSLIEALQDDPGQEGQKALQVRELYLDYQRASFWKTLTHMTRFMIAYAGAGVVVICDNFLPVAGCKKRPQTRVLQLWHACGALKRFGYDTPEDIPKDYRGHVFRNIDRVTVSAPFCVSPFASAMGLPKEAIWPVGICRTDRYFQPGWGEEIRDRFYERHPELLGKKIALWAPTFRGNAGAPEGIALDAEALQKALGEDWQVLSKLHPHMQKSESAGDPKTAGFSTEELFAVADVLIADYSSLVYEYLLFDKPLVLYVPDYEDYVKKRGFYMPYDALPGTRVEDWQDLAPALREAVSQPVDPMQRRRFRETYMSACDGKATERVAAYVREGAADEGKK